MAKTKQETEANADPFQVAWDKVNAAGAKVRAAQAELEAAKVELREAVQGSEAGQFVMGLGASNGAKPRAKGKAKGGKAPEGEVREAILAQLLEAKGKGLASGEFSGVDAAAVRKLFEAGEIERRGERKWARYYHKSHAPKGAK